MKILTAILNFFKRIPAKFFAMDRLTKIIFTALVLLGLLAGAAGYNYVRSITRSMTLLNLPGAPILESPAAGTQEPITAEQEGGQPTLAPWDGNSRVNLLVLGGDFIAGRSDREYGHTDSMTVLTIDPASKTAGMLTIPRDTWVNVPGYGYYTINSAFFLGEKDKLPGGGAALAVETAENFLGIKIHYYAYVNFEVFIKFIDLIGGITVTPINDITVGRSGANYKDNLKAGVQYTLDGALALSYARDRYSSQMADFDRASRQQEVLLAIRNRIIGYNSFPQLVAQAPKLYQELQAYIKTNLDIPKAIQLASLALQLDTNNIKRGIIGIDMVVLASAPDGKSVNIPLPDKVRLLRDDLFAISGTAGPSAQPASGSTLVKDEAARVVVLNGSGAAGLAEKTAEYLRAQGMNVVQTGEAGQYYPNSRLEVFNAKPYSAKFITDTLRILSPSVTMDFNPALSVDLRIILGGDWAANNPMP